MPQSILRRSAAQSLLGCALVVALLGSPVSAELGPEIEGLFRATEYYEINFLADMIDHHAMTIAMSELCEDRAVHQELLAMCVQMAAAQTAEIIQMQTWLNQWYNLDYQPALDDEDLHHLQMLGETTGAEFEIMFLRLMIAHHDGAVKQAVPCTMRAEHAELADLCVEMHDMQIQEIAQMRDWLCDWYDICDPNDQSPTIAITWGAVKSLHR
jgi:hypothetical protein